MSILNIVGSISRYELQQSILISPNRMVVGETNRFGTVDSAGAITSLRTLAHETVSANSTYDQRNLTFQASLIENHFGPGIAAALFPVGAYFDGAGNIDMHKPLWDDAKYLAFRIDIVSHKSAVVFSRGTRLYFASQNPNLLVLLDSAGYITISLGYFNTATSANRNKRVRSSFALSLSSSYSVIWYDAGSDDVNDCKLFINGLEDSFTVEVNDSFVGCVNVDPNHLDKGYGSRIGARSGQGGLMHAYLGKLIESTGKFDLDAIAKSLNSRT